MYARGMVGDMFLLVLYYVLHEGHVGVCFMKMGSNYRNTS